MKGFYTQCYVILTKKPAELSQLHKALERRYAVVKQNPAAENWEFSGESLLVEYDKENNGYLSVDVVDHGWPDTMGSADEPTLFGAWSMGHFGPFAYPGGLKRALSQAWTLSDEQKQLTEYNAFVRLRLSYVLGAGDDVTMRPAQYIPLNELEFLDAVIMTLMPELEDAMYFNPNGEQLLTKELFEQQAAYAKTHSLPALNLYSNVRMYQVDEKFSLLDSVGNQQLDLPDMEVIVPRDEYDLGEIDRYIRNATFYLLTNGEVIKSGDTMEGPGGINWQGFHFENGLCEPPRATIRWFPTNKNQFPASVLPAEPKKPKSPWWKFGNRNDT